MANKAFTYDPETDLGYVRLQIQDNDETPGAAHDFSDTEIAVVIARETRLGLLGAASRLLGMVATSDARCAVRKDRMGLMDDLTQVSKNVSAQSDRLRAQAEEESDDVAAAVFVTPSYTGPAYARNLALDGAVITNVAQEKGP